MELQRRCSDALGELRFTSGARIQFTAPKRIKIEGTLSTYVGNSDRGTFEIVSDGRVTWRRWTVNDNIWETAESASMAVAALTGVSGGACTSIPELLLKSRSKIPFQNVQMTAPKVEEVQIDGQDAWRVYAMTGLGESVYWVDATTCVLLKIHERTDVGKIRNLRADIEAMMEAEGYERPQNAFTPKGGEPEGVTFHDSVEVFTIRSINTELPDALFARPEGMP